MYTEIEFENLSEESRDLIIASLEEKAEGFEETDNALKAIFLSDQYDENLVRSVAQAYDLSFRKKEIEAQNWNALWESNFDPVVVDDFVAIRASFHQPVKNVAHEIVITPKMSFGTGHHATTHLMIRRMRQIDFRNKSVFDFGTGTGILAILAHRLGALQVTANDIDDWSIENARENFESNGAAPIKLLKSDSAELGAQFDVILANINRNVLLDNMPALAKQLNKNGLLILSGILEADQEIIKKEALSNGLKPVDMTSRSQWICLGFER